MSDEEGMARAGNARSAPASNAEGKLLACPFCGGADTPLIKANGIGDSYVICDPNEGGCGASSSDQNCETDEGAIARWNRRPADLVDTASDVDRARREGWAKGMTDTLESIRRAAPKADALEALAELLGQVNQARVGFGVYHNSPSMNAAEIKARTVLFECGVCLPPPPKEGETK